MRAVPRHCPHAGEQSSPCLRQLHLAEAQSVAQLQRIILSKDSGAAGRSVVTANTWLPLSFQPLSSNCIPLPRHCHCLTCRKAVVSGCCGCLGGGSGVVSVDLWLPLFRSTCGSGGYRGSLLVFLHTAPLEYSLPLSQPRLELIPGCRRRFSNTVRARRGITTKNGMQKQQTAGPSSAFTFSMFQTLLSLELELAFGSGRKYKSLPFAFV